MSGRSGSSATPSSARSSSGGSAHSTSAERVFSGGCPKSPCAATSYRGRQLRAASATRRNTMPYTQRTHVPARPDPTAVGAHRLCGALLHGDPSRQRRNRRPALHRRDLGFSEQAPQWVISANALTFVGLLLHGGRAAPTPLRLANGPAPSTSAGGAPRARPVCGAASR